MSTVLANPAEMIAHGAPRVVVQFEIHSIREWTGDCLQNS
jgi:hypothetical protein